MKIMMHNTKVRLPKAPIVLPIIDMSKLSVGHDFANLNTRSCNYKLWNNASHKLAYRRFTYATAVCSEDPESLTGLLFVTYLSTPGGVSDSESEGSYANVCWSNLSKCAFVINMTGIYVPSSFDWYFIVILLYLIHTYRSHPISGRPDQNTLGKQSCMSNLKYLLQSSTHDLKLRGIAL